MSDLSKYPECLIGSIVSPGEYFLINKRGSHSLKVKKLEEKLSKVMAANDHIPHGDEIKADGYVAVEIPVDGGSWKRGRALCKLGSAIFKVFLIDSGYITQVSAKNIRTMNDKKFTKVEPLAFKFCLRGIIPCCVLPGGERKQVAQTWTEGSKYFISSFLANTDVVNISVVNVLNRTVLGDILVRDKKDGQVFSLSRLLCVKSFGLYSLTYFTERVMTLDAALLDPRVLELDTDSFLRIGYKLHKMEEFRLISVQQEGDWAERAKKAVLGKSGSEQNEKGKAEADNDGRNFKRRHHFHNVFKAYSMKNKLRPYSKSGPYKYNTRKPSSFLDHESQMRLALAFGKEGRSAKPLKESLPPGTQEKKEDHEENGLSELSEEHSDISDEYERFGRSKKSKNSKSVGKLTGFREYQIENDKDFRVAFEEKYIPSKLEPISCSEIFRVFYDSMSEPMEKFRELDSWEMILKNTEREADFVDLSPIQKWAIPCVASGHDLIIIGAPKIGKTLSYIIGFLENLRKKMNKGEIEGDKGPIAVILSTASRTCEYVQRSFNLFTTRRNRKLRMSVWDLKVRFVNGSITERHSVAQLLNDCDVLVTTPHCFVRILKQRKVSEFERLCTIVFDEVDKSLEEPFLTQMKVLLHQAKLPKNIQKVFCGEKWTSELETLAFTFARNHSVVIGSYLEAVVYAKLKPIVFYVDDGNKDKALEVALQRFKQNRVVVVCSKNEEVLHLEKFFKERKLPCLIAHSEMLMQELKVVSHRWERLKQPYTVVCSEVIIDDLGIQNANVLINYSLPSDWKCSFSSRFTMISNPLRDRISEKNKDIWPVIFMFLDDKNHFQLPHVMEFLHRMGSNIPSEYKDSCENIKDQIELSKRSLRLCERILKFGTCNNKMMCNRRHTFIKEVDSPEKSLYGTIKFRVLKVHSTNHISARIVEFVDQERDLKTTDLKDVSLDISKRLRKHYYRKEHRKPLSSVAINYLCTLNRCDLSGIKYHRVRILEFKRFRAPNQPVEVLVKLIDWGHVIRVPVDKLLELPEGMKNYPPQATDIFLCNLLPRDSDPDWSNRTITYAKNMFLRDLEDEKIWIGRIRLCLNSILFVDPVKLCHNTEGKDANIIHFSCGPKLMSCGIAEEKTEHLEVLYSMCKKADIDTFAYEYDSRIDENIQPDSAFFDREFLEVQFLSAESVSKIYVRVSKFKDLLRNLEKECQRDGDDEKNSDCIVQRKSAGRKKLLIGMYCLAKYESSWNRAKIHSLEDDKIMVYFIDYGDFEYTESVAPISEKLLTQLPSQAIECYLAGVDPESKITDEIMGEIYAFSNDGNDELYANVIEKNVRSQLTGGWKYGINLLNAEGKSLNKKLIDSGLVRPGNNCESAIDMEDMPSESKTIEDFDYDESDIEYFDKYDNVEDDDLSKMENSVIAESPLTDGTVCPFDELGKIDDMSYFLNMEAEVFDDENAFCMLEEFVSQIAPESVKKKQPEIKAITDREAEPASDSQSDVCHDGQAVGTVSQENGLSTNKEAANILDRKDKEMSPEDEKLGSASQREEVTSPLGGMAYFLRKCGVRNSDSSLPYMKYFPEKSSNIISTKHLLPTNFYTPEIFWSQTHTDIEVKIMLNSVVDYRLDCVLDRFIFRTYLNNKYYVTNVRLYGGIIPDMTRFEIKTFFVQITFQKLCPLSWPRLCRENQKFRWIKYNIEHFTERKCTISEIICSQAIERIEAGDIITPRVTHEVKFVPSSGSDSSDWSDSEEEDFSDKKEMSDQG